MENKFCTKKIVKKVKHNKKEKKEDSEDESLNTALIYNIIKVRENKVESTKIKKQCNT